MRAGSLRHRVEIQRPDYVQDQNSGEMVRGWATAWDKVPCSIEPLSAREFIAASATQSQVTARIVIRYRPGVTSAMRVLHRDRIYAIEGVLADKGSGLEYLTLAVSEGVKDGG